MGVMINGADISLDRIYRYALWRMWDDGKGICMFIGLNPSTADETKDDPTIRRCVGFGKAWGYSGVVMLNLFAYRSTDWKMLYRTDDPVGPDNDKTILSYANQSDKIICAWGVGGSLKGRDHEVMKMLPYPIFALGVTKDGYPKHPLYIPKYTVPVEFMERPTKSSVSGAEPAR